MWIEYQIMLLIVVIALIIAGIICTIFGHFEIINAIICGYGVGYFIQEATYLSKLWVVVAAIAAFIVFMVLQKHFLAATIAGGVISTAFLAYKAYTASFKLEHANIIAAVFVAILVIGLNFLSIKKKRKVVKSKEPKIK